MDKGEEVTRLKEILSETIKRLDSMQEESSQERSRHKEIMDELAEMKNLIVKLKENLVG